MLYKDGMDRGGMGMGMQLQGAMQWGPPEYLHQGGSSSSGSPPVTPQEAPLVSPIPSPYPGDHNTPHTLQGTVLYFTPNYNGCPAVTTVCTLKDFGLMCNTAHLILKNFEISNFEV